MPQLTTRPNRRTKHQSTSASATAHAWTVNVAQTVNVNEAPNAQVQEMEEKETKNMNT